MPNKIVIYSNDSIQSKKTGKVLKEKLEKSGYLVTDRFCPEADLLVCIGGDGTFLRAIHNLDFPSLPIIGINTGHLGFFQEINPDKLDDFIFNYGQEKYMIQNLSPVQVRIKTQNGEYMHTGLNEVVIEGESTRSVHLNISIGGNFIERFSGNGILISSPAGSTAYNYSLKGSIVDPRLKLLQVTPIAPMNTVAYRSFTSSILLPPDLSLGVVPDVNAKNSIKIAYDGFNASYDHIEDITVEFSEKEIHLMRFSDYDFWTKVKSKFL